MKPQDLSISCDLAILNSAISQLDMPLAMTEALAGPPLYLPRREKAKFIKYCPAPARSNNEPKRTKR